MQFVDVKNDVAFRKIFGNENRKEVLISFLNAVLDFQGERRISEVAILNPFQLPALRSGKATIIDVKAKDQRGHEYVVEMQVAEVSGFNQRVLYYTSKSYVDQISRGEFYDKLKPAIFIGILEFSHTQNPHFLSRHRILDIETGEQCIRDIEFNFIELPKFTKKREEITSLVEKWVYFIKEADNLEVWPEHLEDDGLKSAYEEANIQTWTKEELNAYDYASMREQDERGRMSLAVERAEDQGEKRGTRNAQLKIAKNLLSLGLAVEVVAQNTGLSIEEVQQLASE
ncbi:MAG: Rpn family recombination-promoting nuclease/putative transposase [Bacteroidota bacterium]